MGQGLLAKRMGKSRVIAETGAGQHGVATATMAAKLGFQCTIYMGHLDMVRQMPNVFWMERLGAQVVPVTDGQMKATHSIAPGLDYVGVSPILASLWEEGRIRFEATTNHEVLEAFSLTVKKEGLVPALESAHAFAQAFKEVPDLSKDDLILINQSGRGDKDIFSIADACGDIKWQEFIKSKAEEYSA